LATSNRKISLSLPSRFNTGHFKKRQTKAEISRIFFRIQSTFPKAGNKKAANLFRLTAHVPLWDGVIQL
jgi:hypothetical protein